MFSEKYSNAYPMFLASVRGTPYHIQLSVLAESPASILVKETILDYTHRFGNSEVKENTKEYTPEEYIKFALRVQSNIEENREKVYNKNLDNTFYNVLQNDLLKPILTGAFASIVNTIKKVLPESVSYPSNPRDKTVRISYKFVNDEKDTFKNPNCTFYGRFDLHRIIRELPKGQTVADYETVCDLYKSHRFYYIIIKNFANDVYCTIKIKKDNFVRERLYEIAKGDSFEDSLKPIICKLLGYRPRIETFPKSIL